MDLFAAACGNFGLVINKERTVVMYQLPPDAAYAARKSSLTSAATAFSPTVIALNPNAPTNINLPTINAGDLDSVQTCPYCDSTSASHTGLVIHLRIHRTETGDPMPGAPTLT
nr:unnamed protein product [Spirometra erinaceieuropaei]